MISDVAKTKDVAKLVVFQLGIDLFAAEIASVDRVLRYEAPAAVPDVPVWIAGVIAHRGKATPVVDLRRRLALADLSITPETRVVVLNTAGGWVGAMVDAVREVAAVPTSAVQPPPPLFRGLEAQFVRGVATINDQLVVVLDVDRVLTSADRIVFEQAVDGAAVEPAARV